MTLKEWSLLVVLSILWGSSFYFLAIARPELPAFTIAAARMLLAGGAMLLVMGFRLPWDAPSWGRFLVLGFFNDAGPFVLLALSTGFVPTGLASVLIATSPLFTVLLAHFLTTDERLTPRRAIGILVGFAGLAVMLGSGRIELDLRAGLGAIACLGAALGYAYASIYGRRFSARGLSPMVTAAGQLTSSAIVMLPIALIIDRPWTLAAPSWPATGSVVALGLLTGALAYSIFFRILASAGATNAVLVTFMSPITAILLGIAALGERLTMAQLGGMALVAAGLAVLDGRPLAWMRRR